MVQNLAHEWVDNELVSISFGWQLDSMTTHHYNTVKSKVWISYKIASGVIQIASNDSWGNFVWYSYFWFYSERQLYCASAIAKN